MKKGKNSQKKKGGGRFTNFVKGWSQKVPKRSERKKLAQKCPKCFLDVKNKKFPVCYKCQSGVCSCKNQCDGLFAARMRAKILHYDNIAEEALKRAKNQKCEWVKHLKKTKK